MIYLNIVLAQLRNHEFAGVSNDQLGVWLRLCAFCCDQENGGVIKHASEWDNQKWMRAVGVSIQDIEAASTLWFYNNTGSLQIAHYPASQEAAMLAEREAKRKGGQSISQAKQEAARKNGLKGGRMTMTPYPP